MNLFPTAFAEDAVAPATAQQGGDLTMLIVLAIGFVFFYVFLLRPQNKKRKEAQMAIAQITVGDEVLTNGGIIGRVIKESEDKDLLTIQISENTTVIIKRAYVISALPKGTFEQYQTTSKQK